MSVEYQNYLQKHIQNVQLAYDWLSTHVPEIWKEMIGYEWQLKLHDQSKYSLEEYDAYDKYFYGNNKSYQVVNDFNYAWLHHIHNNPHHWQYWVLEGDDDPDKALEMPFRYVIEMICDWWSFSFASGNYYEIFDWYKDHERKMKLHPNTRRLVIKILNDIRKELDKEKEENNESV